MLAAFRPFFKDARIRKVWHNYSFDRHVLANMGMEVAGFAGDTMHMARLWNSSRMGKGYSLENLSRCAAPPRPTAPLAALLRLLAAVDCAACFGRARLLEYTELSSFIDQI